MSKLNDAYHEMRSMKKMPEGEENDTSVNRGLIWFESFGVDPVELFKLVDETLSEIILASLAEGAPGTIGPALGGIWFKVGVLYGMDRAHDHFMTRQ